MRTLIFLIALVTLAAWSAHADELAYSEPVDGDFVVTGVSFGANPQMGRAWLEVQLHQSNCDYSDTGCSLDHSDRVKLRGLVFDPATETITYSEGGSAPTVCGSLIHHHFIGRWTTVRETGLCGVTRVLKATQMIDDGFEMKTVEYRNYYFGINFNGR